jgi:hypothetical protein
MTTTSSEYRAITYWPNEDSRIIFCVKRTPETDAMTDDELAARHGPYFERNIAEEGRSERPDPA